MTIGEGLDNDQAAVIFEPYKDVVSVSVYPGFILYGPVYQVPSQTVTCG